MKKYGYISLLIIVFVACGSAPDQLGKSEYLQWVKNPDNGLVKTKSIGDYSLELQYRPHELIALTEDQSLDQVKLNERCSQLSSSQYFNLKLKSNDPLVKVMDIGNRSEQDYFLKVDYFSNQIQHDLKLIDGQDTLNCMFSVFERTYDLAPHITFALAFENAALSKGDKTLYFDGSKLGLGPVYLSITQEEIENIPNLTVG